MAPATAREIAADLVVTEAAVKQHLLRLYQKFRIAEGTNRRTRLANEVVALGLVRPLPLPGRSRARRGLGPAWHGIRDAGARERAWRHGAGHRAARGPRLPEVPLSPASPPRAAASAPSGSAAERPRLPQRGSPMTRRVFAL